MQSQKEVKMKRTELEKSRILAKRVRAKTLKHHLIKRLQDRFDICEAESEAIAHKTLQYLDTKLGDTRRYNQVIVDGCELKKEDIKGKFRSLKIRLTYYDDSDLEVEERYGKDGARYNRVIRCFEEAYSQGGVLKATTIASVLGTSRKMITKIVCYYRTLGVRVELRRQHKRGHGGCYRDVKAMGLLLEGTEKEEALKRLFMGPTSLRDALDELALIGELKERGFNYGEIGTACLMPAQKVKEYEELWKKYRGNSAIPRREAESEEHIQEYGEAISRNSLFREISRQYDFSPGAVRLFFNEIDGFERELKADGLRENEVIYYAVREEIGAGRAIAECRLVPVRLSIYSQEDGRGFVGDSSPEVERVCTRMIKETRINRWAIETKQGCGLLSLEDVSYLLGLHSTSISQPVNDLI